MSFQNLLLENHLDGLLVTSKINRQYLTSFHGAHEILLTKNQNYLFTDFRHIEEAEKNRKLSSFQIIDITKDKEKKIQAVFSKHRLKKLGYEGNSLTIIGYKKLKKTAGKIHLKNTENLLEKLRTQKNKEEIQLIIEAQKITEKIFQKIKRLITVGQTEKSLNWKIKMLIYESDAKFAFEPIVAFGPNTSCPHHESTDRQLKKGDLIILDFGASFQGYHSDMTRMLFTEKPSSKQEKIYNLVLKAQQNVLDHLKIGLPCDKIDQLGRQPIEEAGFAENFQHGLGHGVGLQIHEAPHLSLLNKNKIPENAVFTVEPGIYLPGKFGIRIEDLVVLRKTGVENLTTVSKEIEIIKI